MKIPNELDNRALAKTSYHGGLDDLPFRDQVNAFGIWSCPWSTALPLTRGDFGSTGDYRPGTVKRGGNVLSSKELFMECGNMTFIYIDLGRT
jgi:hypothetical protein